MNKQMGAILHDMHRLAEDARSLIEATANVTGETAKESRERLVVTLERGKKLYGDLSEKAYDEALAADEAVSKYVYHVVGIVAGAFLGYFTARRCGSNRE
jgi:ElaB/YqjD/DUF883 family membrane-anchored ribosome-binding protein